jgi:hypothetical protein
MKTKIIWAVIIVVSGILGLAALPKIALLCALLFSSVSGKAAMQPYEFGRAIGNLAGMVTAYGVIIFGIVMLGRWSSNKIASRKEENTENKN